MRTLALPLGREWKYIGVVRVPMLCLGFISFLEALREGKGKENELEHKLGLQHSELKFFRQLFGEQTEGSSSIGTLISIV